nr:reverse transcriptase domain-containing protein [Tanacetum cinerariifolium]
RSKQPFILEESPVDTMADQRTMAELLRAPTEGYAEAIVVPPILADQYELKHSLINMMTLDQYKDFLRACPHHGFTELHQLDTFYNALNPADQDSLNAAAGGNMLERRTQDVLTIIENKSKGELKAITTRSGIILDGPSVPTPPLFINPEEGERVEETLTDWDLAEVPLILGRPFLRIARALIDVHGEEMILRDGDERLTLNMRHDTSSYSNQPQKESVNMINIFNDSSEDFLENLFIRNHQSGNPTFSSHPKLTSPEVKDNVFDPEEGNIEPDQGKLTSVVMKDNLAEPRVHVPNVLTTHPTLMLNSDLIPSDNSLPEYKIFYFDIEEKNSGSTTIHVDISLSNL